MKVLGNKAQKANLKDRRDVALPIGKIRIKTLVKFLTLYGIAKDRRRSLTAQEVAQAITCSKGHAYNYVRALDKLLETQLAP